MKITRSEALFAVTTAVLAAAASWLGLSENLGAHPWWAPRTGLIGAPIGLALFLAARALSITPKWLTILAALALIAAIFSAQSAKTTFVTAEDFNPSAGRIWFFGWIAIWAAITLLLPSLFAMRRQGGPLK